MPKEASTGKYSARDWDETRLKFSTSLMVDTSLISLSQNAELRAWPIKGDNENPSKYIDFNWEELNEISGLADNPRNLDLLIDILKETMSFDEPFGDMVSTVEENSVDDTIEKNLEKLKIPEDFPLRLGSVSKDTLEFCKSEKIETIGEFAAFSQRVAQNIIVGGDFKALLNCLVHSDEKGIAKFLPFRPHHTGLHLEEAMGILISQLSETELMSLLKRYGRHLSDEDSKKARLSKDQAKQLEDILQQRTEELVKFFTDDYATFQKKLKSGTTAERLFIVLNDENREIVCAQTLKRYLKVDVGGDIKPEKKGGFFKKIFGRR
ncbi:hypothetical protein [Rubellicoccus peritrichatus]|uniref:Uncharacterized protein n=1 Tax=Rubellicoccus peritrichatus TaxID=3080537 RepID=A0AAQ3LH65_9BACT|nr:hypothetical protein [Puniceicoccus sp. CR14]WOO42064.1 hypothetical protein RZN69_03120 [Puniceicoccus sp. CR14]